MITAAHCWLWCGIV